MLTYYVDVPIQNSCTKRSILSTIAKLYDPLGLISPCTILAKIMIQKLWYLKLDWDEHVPIELQGSCNQFRENLTHLNTLRIPRQVCNGLPCTIQLHGFSDASQSAYSACIYVRSVDESGAIDTQLACAKSKVAPLKLQTIPRLELCGALLLCKLRRQVLDSLSVNPDCYYWSDSKVVLAWLKLQPCNLQTFVSHRVSEIQGISDVHNCNYVSTKENPADLASRGIYPKNLPVAELWWKGHHWLSKMEIDWPSSQSPLIVDNLLETKKITLITALIKPLVIHNIRNKNERLTDDLTVNELDQSMKTLVRFSQFDSFSNEIKLHNNRRRLRRPFFDQGSEGAWK